MKKINDPAWVNRTQRARENFWIAMLWLSFFCLFIGTIDQALGADPTERKWTKPIFYELQECPTNKKHDWFTWFEEAIAEIEPLTVDFIPSPSPSATSLLVKCSPVNFLQSQLIYVEDGQDIESQEVLELGTTRSRFFVSSQEMIRADIWLNEMWAFDFRKVIRHELGHALGIGYHLDDGCKDCQESLMNSFPSIGYWDVYTLAELQNRYGGQYAITDQSNTKYTPCLWVDKSIAALFDAEQGFYWTIEENREGFWEVIEFGEADCERD